MRPDKSTGSIRKCTIGYWQGTYSTMKGARLQTRLRWVKIGWCAHASDIKFIQLVICIWWKCRYQVRFPGSFIPNVSLNSTFEKGLTSFENESLSKTTISISVHYVICNNLWKKYTVPVWIKSNSLFGPVCKLKDSNHFPS